MTVDTGPAKLPGLPALRTEDKALARWAQAVAEHLEVRAGARGNPLERAVTQRDLEAIAGSLTFLQDDTKRLANPGDVLIDLGGGLSASIAIDKFGDALKQTQLYKDLLQRLDDPDRENPLTGPYNDLLLQSVAQEAANTTKIQRLEASLAGFYQDGTPGRAVLEQSFKTVADRVTGLRAQYTLKVQAGGALAGFGIAAEEVNGVPSSAFIISADKFAIVSPNYRGGLRPSPDNNNIPFAVDANGIYLNTNVYVKGTLRVDTGGKTLTDGMRGSLNGVGTGDAWSDNVARQVIWSLLGKTGSPLNNNHLVIGDTVTIKSATGTFIETRSWFGAAWTSPGAVINGNLLVSGTIAAAAIDTRNLTVRDANGNIILGAGTLLAGTYIANAAIGSAQIANILQSANFNGTVDANGNITNAGTTGWAISKAGKTAFSDVTVRGALTFIDQTTGQQLQAVSSTSFQGSVSLQNAPGYQVQTFVGNDANGNPQYVTTYNAAALIQPLGISMVFYPPANHFHPNALARNRVRAGPVLYIATANAIVDHYMSIWYRVYSNSAGAWGAWAPLSAIIEPAGGYGNTGLQATAILDTNFTTAVAIDFTVAPVDTQPAVQNPNSVELRYLSFSVQAYNI